MWHKKLFQPFLVFFASKMLTNLVREGCTKKKTEKSLVFCQKGGGVLPFKLALLCWLFWPTMTKNNKGNLFVFEVGPGVKFVSAIKDVISKKKRGSIFFRKKDHAGGGGRSGGWQKTTLFRLFF